MLEIALKENTGEKRSHGKFILKSTTILIEAAQQIWLWTEFSLNSSNIKSMLNVNSFG